MVINRTLVCTKVVKWPIVKITDPKCEVAGSAQWCLFLNECVICDFANIRIKHHPHRLLVPLKVRSSRNAVFAKMRLMIKLRPRRFRENKAPVSSPFEKQDAHGETSGVGILKSRNRKKLSWFGEKLFFGLEKLRYSLRKDSSGFKIARRSKLKN